MIRPLPLALSATPASARDLEVTSKGIAILARTPQRGPDPFENPPISAVLVRWHELRGLELLDPWPSFRLRWGGRGARGDATFTPHFHEDPREFVAALERLVVAATERAPTVVARGWLDAPDVSWEPTDELPVATTPQTGPTLGVFRTPARDVSPPEATVLARRKAPPTFEALVLWLRSSPRRPLDLLPREAAITADGMLHVRWRDRRCARIPVDTVRLRFSVPIDEEHSPDAIYVFGRATRLLLVDRAHCEVAQQLDLHLDLHLDRTLETPTTR
jgi:hypothetical protein